MIVFQLLGLWSFLSLQTRSNSGLRPLNSFKVMKLFLSVFFSLKSRPITLLPELIDKSEPVGSIATEITTIITATHRPKVLPIQPRAATILQPLQQSYHQTDLPSTVPPMPKTPPSNQPCAFTRHQKSLRVSLTRPTRRCHFLSVIFHRVDQIRDQNPSNLSSNDKSPDGSSVFGCFCLCFSSFVFLLILWQFALIVRSNLSHCFLA
jgi:hypothetical protein